MVEAWVGFYFGFISASPTACPLRGVRACRHSKVTASPRRSLLSAGAPIRARWTGRRRCRDRADIEPVKSEISINRCTPSSSPPETAPAHRSAARRTSHCSERTVGHCGHNFTGHNYITVGHWGHNFNGHKDFAGGSEAMRWWSEGGGGVERQWS